MISGIIAGAFDVIHPGYVYMFQEAKKYCDKLFIALHIDPTIERKEKHKPILSASERKLILSSIRYIDEIFMYSTEEELNNILKYNKYHVRILGDDYRDRYATGQEYSEKIIYVNRSHGWSTTKYKKLIIDSNNGEKQ